MTTRINRLLGAGLLCSFASLSGAGHAQPAAGVGEWPSYNRTLTGDRNSPLTQVTRANVGTVRPVCSAQLGETAAFASGIIVAEDTLFVTTQLNTYAFDPATCRRKWKHSFPFKPVAGRLNTSRGATFSDGKLYRGVDAGYLVALDAATGKELWRTKASDLPKGESLSAAPVVWNGTVFIGTAGGDYFGVRGRMMAFRQSDGKPMWSFDLVPLTGPGSETWPPSTAEAPRQGGGSYSSYSIDAGRGLVYVGTGNPGPDWDKKSRPGLNLYTSSVVALDARTGALRGYYQLDPNGFHDWNLSAAPTLVRTAGGRDLVLAAGKDGFLHGLDQRSLKPIYKTAVTTIDNIKAPFNSVRNTRFCPGTHGGVQWNGPAFHRAENTVFVNSVDWCVSIKLAPKLPAPGVPGVPWTGGAKDAVFGTDDPKSRWGGWLTAVNADTGKIRWKYRSPTPLLAGVTTTATGLVLTGDLNGNMMAFDSRSGKQLWKNNAGAPIGGGVVTYLAGGKQYIAAAVGHTSGNWGTKGGNAKVAVYALP